MRIRHGVTALVVAAVPLLATAAPASAGPSTPPDCTFAAGVLSCSTSTTTTDTLGPYSTGGALVPGTTTFGGVTGAAICRSYFGPNAPQGKVELNDVSLDVTTTTTTTTQRRGLQGKVFATSTSTSEPTLTGVSLGNDRVLICSV